MEKITKLVNKAQKEHQLTQEEILFLLEEPKSEEPLAEAADLVRREHVGDGIHLRGLIEFSNICRSDCFYCGLRKNNKNVERYRLKSSDILHLAQKAKAYNYKTIVLQSGEDMFFTPQVLGKILRELKQMDFALTLSIGERDYSDYEAFKKAGADRFLLRIETTDQKLYQKLHPHMSFQNRLRSLRDLRKLGFEVGTGFLVGLPEQSLLSLAKDILFVQNIDADMIGIGPFLPHKDTPLRSEQKGDFHLTKRILSLLRLLCPTANIPATTAMETLKPNSREEILKAGANVIMPNLTEGTARKNYALYEGKAGVLDTPEESRKNLENIIKNIGRHISTDYGFRRK